jgi:hypothetical protein
VRAGQPVGADRPAGYPLHHARADGPDVICTALDRTGAALDIADPPDHRPLRWAGEVLDRAVVAVIERSSETDDAYARHCGG